MENFIVKKCRLDEIFQLRWEVLRNSRPREEAEFEGDFNMETYHIGVFDKENGKVLCCASFMKNDLIFGHAFVPNGYQLRGMATRTDLQGKGLGISLLKFSKAILLRENKWLEYFWCNARISAREFYEKNGWEVMTQPFIVNISGEEIPHVKMYKNLQQISMK